MIEHPASPPDLRFHQRLSKNIALNTVYFVFNFIVGLCLVPFYLNTLGPAAYGLIPLATSITSYAVLVIDAMNASISRFLSIDLQKGDYKQANKTYNTARFGVISLILILLPIVILTALFVPQFLNIGTETYETVSCLLLLVLGSALIGSLSAPFTAVFVAYNRLDYSNYVNLINLFIQAGLVVFLLVFVGHSLIFVGISCAAAAVVSVITGYILFKKTAPYLKLSRKEISTALLKPIVSQAFWSALFSAGLLLRYPLCLIIVNIFLGAIAATEFSFGITLATALLSLSGLITSTFRPQIYMYRATEDTNGIINFCSRAIKLTGLLIALPLGLLCTFAATIMTIWIGEEYSVLWPFIWLMVIPVFCQILASCIGPINAAYMKVRPVALVTIAFGLVTFVLALILPKIFENGIIGVGIACAVSVIGVSALFSPLYNAHIIQAPKFSFLKPMIWGWVAVIIVLAAGILYQYLLPVNSLVTLIIACAVITLLYLFVVIKWVLTADELKVLVSIAPGFVQKIMPKWLFW